MQRLFLDAPLDAAVECPLDKAQSNYLLNVLRMGQGDHVLVFNGQNGEWLARIELMGKKKTTLVIEEQTQPQPAPLKLIYCFAPLKHARLDYMVQKAAEMGAGVLQPVLTHHTQTHKLNVQRMEANVIEAAEQCGLLSLPSVHTPLKLDALLADWPEEVPLVFCDERDGGQSPSDLLSDLKTEQGKIGVLIGPEGGFSEDERRRLLDLPFVQAIPLGPRILRADTAAVAALALVQATLGDW